ncbi:YrhK family protein [Halomonas sp. I5-271120]|uniref:YrhK family protein n=1 Tax=Halomonas sp. I5-271120 TaxID=3061632 RepID=UPI002714613B|nr:YrhK family protein [Halomonas sp. I5-271120]
MAQQQSENSLTLHVGHEELVIRQRYEALSIFNDVLIALWFLAGSILFLYPAQEHLAIWMFIIGSFQFLVRPAIRLARHLHLQRIPDIHGDG